MEKENGNSPVNPETIHDIIVHKQAEDQLKHMVTHDSLTGLPTLQLAMDRLAMAMGMARRNKNLTGVMVIDLDNFKDVNDTCGRAAGDYVLKQIAHRLLSCMRETDTVARIGGDEYLLVTPGMHSFSNAREIAQKILQAISPAITLNEGPVSVGVSIGIAIYPTHAEDVDTLIKLADEAMGQVKKSGKNNFGFAKIS